MEQIFQQAFKGQKFVVTGATAGIGEDLARRLGSMGVRVYAVGRREERLRTLSESFPSIVPVVMDLQNDLQPLKDLAEKEAIDVLVNNAGMAAGRSDILGTSMEQVDQMLDTNLRALIAVTKIFLPGMKARDFGDIVNLGSIAGFFTYPSGSVYNATKFGVHALSQAWRQDLVGTNVRVMEVSPGMVETEFSVVRYQGDEAKAKKVYEGMRPLTAHDITDSILWALAAPRHVTIQNILIMPTDQASINLVHRRE